MKLKGQAGPHGKSPSLHLADFRMGTCKGPVGEGGKAFSVGVPKPSHYVWMPWDWMCAANRLGGSALAVGALLWYRSKVTGVPEVILSNVLATSAGLSRKAKTGGLQALVEGGLARMDGRPGRSPRVSLLPVVRQPDPLVVTPSPAAHPETFVGKERA